MQAVDSKYSKCIYFSSNALARKIEKLAIEFWKEVDLSPSHAYLLMLVVEEPGMQPTGLSAQLRLTPSTITRLIEKLEEKKLVVRTTEGKITNVYPTPKAKEMLPTMHRIAIQYYDMYCSILGREESDRLAKNMIKVADKLGE